MSDPSAASPAGGLSPESTSARRPRPPGVTVAVVLMYLGGLAQIALGIGTIFLRYAADAAAEGIGTAVTLLGAGMILFGLFVIALASGVARGSRAARTSATVVMVLGLALMLLDALTAGDDDWSGVVIQSLATVAVVAPLRIGRGRRYFLR